MVLIEGGQDLGWLDAASGLLGVILGAGLTYFITYQFERRRVRQERLGRSYNLFFAVLKIADDLCKMELDLKAGLARAEAAGIKGEVWTKLTSSIGFSDPIVIPPEDLAVVALTRDNDLTLKISEMEAAHRIYTTSMRKLDDLRDKFETFEVHSGMEGETVTFVADETQLARIGPTIIRLRTLGESIAKDLPDAAFAARCVAEKLGPHLKKYYKFKHFISMSFPPQAVDAAESNSANAKT